MQKKRINDRGFSLVELIIVVAILAVLIGIVAPQYLRYVERSKRVKDIHTAVQIRDAFDRIFAIDNPSMMIGGSYYSGGGWDNTAAMPVAGDPGNTYLDMVFLDLGAVPQSSDFQNFMWYVYTDPHLGCVTKIELWETSGPGGPPVQGYEIWPNSDAFFNH